MNSKKWTTCDNGSIEFFTLTPARLEECIDVIKNSFMIHENVCVALGLPKKPEAVDELLDLFRHAAQDGVSIIAVEKSSSKIAGVSINKLQLPEHEQELFLQDYEKRCKHPSAKAYIQFVIAVDAVYDFYKEHKVDCMIEIMFLTTLAEFRGRGIAKTLCEASITMAKSILNGKTSITPFNSEPTMGIFPKCVISFFTSSVSQGIGKSLGFEKVADIFYKDYTFAGKSYASYIKDTPSVSVVYLQL